MGRKKRSARSHVCRRHWLGLGGWPVHPYAQAHRNVIGGSARIEGASIQAGHVNGGIHVHQQSAPPRPVPRQLPRVPPHFTGRERELAALSEIHDRAADGEAPLIVVSGPAGIGKTALVSRWVRARAESRFPDGCLYADLRGHAPEGPVAPGDVLGQFLRALGLTQTPTGLPELMGTWRTLTAPLRIAVVIDNAISAAQTTPLIPGGEGNLTIVTSRFRLTGLRIEGAVPHQLGPLDADASWALLSRGIGEDRLRADAGATDRVVELCAGFPLALCLASAWLSSRPRQPVHTMADTLARDPRRAATLTGEGAVAAVHTALDECYAVLPAEAARLYRRLGAFPFPVFESRLAAAAGGLSLDEADRVLDDLLEANLVEDVDVDRWRLHDVVRRHAAALARHEASEDGGTAWAEALRRACDWFLATATAAQRILTPVQAVLERTVRYPPDLSLPFDDEAGALGWLDARRADLLVAVRTAVERGWDDTAWQLVDAMWPLFSRLRHYPLWIEAHELGRAAAHRAGNGDAERQMLNSGAIGLSAAGRLETAIDWYTASLDAARGVGDRRDEGQALLGLGAAHREAGRFEGAIPYLAEAIEVWNEVGYLRGTALARIVLGEIAIERGRYQQAETHFRLALSTMTELDEPYEVARARVFLGQALSRMGDHGGAESELRQALEVFEVRGTVHWQARTLDTWGDSAARAGDHSAARGHRERALALFASSSPKDAARLRELLGERSPSADPDPSAPPASGHRPATRADTTPSAD
ncbi:regulator [Streptomyces sp. PT12]|nr:regulator [Streptomyces sp. PT12]